VTTKPENKPARAGSGNSRPNTLGLPAEAVERLSDRLDDKSGEGRGNTKAAATMFRRDFVRLPFRKEALTVRVIHPGGSATTLKLACRNISCGGVSLLHSAYVHLGTEMVVTLPHPARGTIDARGRVVRCKHWATILHEIGVKFDEQIDVRQLVRQDQLNGLFSVERVDPARLRGCVVYVDDSPLDQKIFRHLLRNTELRVRMTNQAEEALRLVKEGCDVIVCDFYLGKTTGDEFIKGLRAAGVITPVIALTADSTVATRQKLADAQANAIVTKPLTEERLLQALADFLLERAGDETPGTPESDSADEGSSLARGFIAELKGYAERLAASLREGKPEECYMLCTQIKGTAPVVGFHALAKLAGAAVENLASTTDTKESSKAVQELIAACQRIGCGNA
jgi:CheY-like chemotaxis protein